jgi:hypothetical protein
LFNQRDRDENLLVVAAVEGYALKHNVSARDALELFDKHGLLAIIRAHYGALHTQALDESAAFAEDVLGRLGA